MVKLQVTDIIKALDAEKDWCVSATDEEKKGTTQEFRDGFIAGIEQAKRLIKMMSASE
jgi:hypothetical protein